MFRWFFGIVLIGLLAGLLTTLIIRPSLAFTLGVTPAGVAAEVKPRQEVCQRPIQIPADGEFDRVGFSLGTYFRPGPPVTLSVHDDRNGRVLATAKLRGGYPDIADAPRHVLDLGKKIGTERPIRVCLANTGTRKVAVFGNANVANRPSGAFMRGEELPSDLALTFEREPRSVLSLAPAVAERLSLFRPRWVGPWTFLVLLLLAVVAAPALLWRAVRTVEPEPPA